MKTKPAKKYIKLLFRFFLISGLALVTCGCQSRAEKFYKQAINKIQQRQFLEAADLLEDSAELEKNNRLWSKTNFELARVLRFEIQDFNKSLKIYKLLILKSEDSSIRLQSQEAIAEIYFDNLQDYTSAIKEYLLLESIIHDPSKLESIRLKVAQGYRYTGNHKTALEYIDVYLNSVKEQKSAFLKLKAQTLVTLGQPDEALKIYTQLLLTDAKYFEIENLFVAVARVFEEKQDYKQAISFLSQNKDKIKDTNYVELRLKRLQEKLQNKPFLKGVRK